MSSGNEALTWAVDHLWLVILVPIVLVFAIGFVHKPDPAAAALSRRLFWARLARPRHRVVELHAFAMSRARGGGSWSVHVVFDGPRRERLELGSGAPCEQDFAQAVTEWATRMAAKLRVPPSITSGSDC